MAELKTKENNASVKNFIDSVPDKVKKEDSFALLKLFQQVTGEKPKMWGDSIVGFGKYHYKSDRSSREGDWMIAGFSPRKQALTIYLLAGVNNFPALLKKLGKHKVSGGSCIYIKKLEDVDSAALKQLIAENHKMMKARYNA